MAQGIAQDMTLFLIDYDRGQSQTHRYFDRYLYGDPSLLPDRDRRPFHRAGPVVYLPGPPVRVILCARDPNCPIVAPALLLIPVAG